MARQAKFSNRQLKIQNRNLHMPDTVIKAENLSKQYRIGARESYKTFRETLVDAAKAPLQDFKQIINRKLKILYYGIE